MTQQGDKPVNQPRRRKEQEARYILERALELHEFYMSKQLYLKEDNNTKVCIMSDQRLHAVKCVKQMLDEARKL